MSSIIEKLIKSGIGTYSQKSSNDHIIGVFDKPIIGSKELDSEILNETLVDRVLELIDYNKENILDINSDQFIDSISDILKNKKVYVFFNQTSYLNIFGKIRAKSKGNITEYHITIYLPKNSRLTSKDEKIIVITLLHELSHIITDKRIDEKIPEINLDNIYDSNQKYLDYVFHRREMSNWAFSIVIDNIFNFGKYDIDKLIQLNKDIILKYKDNKIKLNELDIWKNKLIGDSQSLFNIQFSVIFSKGRTYKDKFKSFKKLMFKYEKRIKRIVSV